MASKKISQLNAIAEIDNLDILPIVDESSDETKQVTVQQLKDKINEGVGGNWGDIEGNIEDQEDLQAELDLKADNADLSSHVSNTSNPHNVTKSQVGLGNADNTSDASKPISTATQTALNLKLNTSEKGAINGVATLGADQKIPTSQLPALAITDTFVVLNQSEMLSLSAQTGDVAIRIDLSKSFILSANDPSILANWKELLTPTDTVLSVNGQTGVVNLTTTNISEGTNLYFTDERAVSALTGENISIFNNDAGYVTDLSGYVPYTGASADVDLGANKLIANEIATQYIGSVTGGNGGIYPDLQLIQDASNVNSIDWNSRVLYSNDANSSIDFQSRVLYNSSNSQVLDYASAYLIDPASSYTVAQWNGYSGFLFLPTGVALNSIVDLSGQSVINAGSRQIFDEYGSVVIEFGYGSSYGVAIYNGLQVSNIFSFGGFVDFGSGGDVSILTQAFVDNSGYIVIDKFRGMYDSSGIQVLDFSSGFSVNVQAFLNGGFITGSDSAVPNIYGSTGLGSSLGLFNAYPQDTSIILDTVAVNFVGKMRVTGGLPTSDPADGTFTLWVDTMTNIVYQGT